MPMTKLAQLLVVKLGVCGKPKVGSVSVFVHNFENRPLCLSQQLRASCSFEC